MDGMDTKTFSLLFDLVATKLPISYGVLIGAEMNDTNKSKMKKTKSKKCVEDVQMGVIQTIRL